MSKHRIMVTQVLRIERKVAITVEAENSEEVDALVDGGEYSLPATDSPEWETVSSSVEHEEAYAL